MIAASHNSSLSSLSSLEQDRLTSCLSVCHSVCLPAFIGRQTDRHAAYPTSTTQNPAPSRDKLKLPTPTTTPIRCAQCGAPLTVEQTGSTYTARGVTVAWCHPCTQARRQMANDATTRPEISLGSLPGKNVPRFNLISNGVQVKHCMTLK